MARLPSPRHTLHGRLWLPRRPAGDASPLSTAFRQRPKSGSPSPRSSPAPLFRSGPSDTFQTPSQLSAENSPSPSSSAWLDVRAAHGSLSPLEVRICDAVRLRPDEFAQPDGLGGGAAHQAPEA